MTTDMDKAGGRKKPGKLKTVTVTVPLEKFEELAALVLSSGIGAASIARAGLYQEMARMKTTKEAA